MSTLLSQNEVFNKEKRDRRKLIIIPAYCNALGGMTVSLSLLITGFERCGASEQLRVLVRKDSLMERYLKEAGQGSTLELIESNRSSPFLKSAFRWVAQQPSDWPLLLDNCVWRKSLPIIMQATPALRLSRRPVYHFCHDLALSHNPLGYLVRKVTFTCLAPKAICNSKFTAGHVRGLMPDIRGILYQPVDLERFNNQSPKGSFPEGLKPILNSGARDANPLTPQSAGNCQ